jgi:hypothetical protein
MLTAMSVRNDMEALLESLVEAYEVTRAGKPISTAPTLHKAMVKARLSVLDARGSKGPTIVTHRGKVIWHSDKDKWSKHSTH